LPFAEAHAVLLPRIAPAMCVGEGIKVYQRPDGSYLQGGDRLIHPDHFRAYQLLLDEPDAFYRGEYAEALVAAVDDGGALSQEDLKAYAVVESTPRTAAIEGFTVYARGNDLDGVLRTLDHAGEHIPGDPATDPASALGLVEALRAPAKRAETTNIVAVDENGDGCAITTSLGLGSGVWVPGFGVHLNSMMGEGELVREQLEPGVRMGSMMSPLVALDDDGLGLIAGAAGGSRIRPALVQTMLRMLRGMPPQQAIDAPRLNALRDLVRLEPGFAPEVLEALRSAGHRVAVTDHRDPYFGGVSAISPLGGGADPRRSGYVIML
jgi:gamma-glutamyltranspeptidase/glutathione hydrolase